MKSRLLMLLSAALILAAAGTVSAEEKFGVKVYPGAEYEASATKFVRGMATSGEACCYRTEDTALKVAEFYKKKPDLGLIAPATEEGAFFNRRSQDNPDCGPDIDLTIQSPWMDMQTREMNHDSLLCIVNREQ